jgi:hypothetical protein
MWGFSVVVLSVLGMGSLFVLAATVQKLLSFRAEVQRMRIASELDETPALRVGSDRDGLADLREADMLLANAEGDFDHGLRRLKWTLIGLGGAPADREAQLVAACRELLEANQAVKQAALKLHGFDATGIDEVPLFHDPVRELAGQGRWGAFALLSLTPRFVGGIYSYRRVKSQLVPLLDATRTLQEQVASYRKTHEPAPVRRRSVRQRVETARPLAARRFAAA